MFISGQVDYLWIIVKFLSTVWTQSDGTHSLQGSTDEQVM